MDYLESTKLLIKNGVREDAIRREIAKTLKYNKGIKELAEKSMEFLRKIGNEVQEILDASDEAIVLLRGELKKRPKFEVGDVCRAAKSERTFSAKDIIGKCVFITDVHAITNEDAVSLFGKFYYMVDGVPHGIWENELELVARGKDFYKNS